MIGASLLPLKRSSVAVIVPAKVLRSKLSLSSSESSEFCEITEKFDVMRLFNSSALQISTSNDFPIYLNSS